MVERLHQWDLSLLLACNQYGGEPWDTLVWYATKTWVWIPLFAVALVWLIRRYGLQAWRPAILTVIASGFSDGISSGIMKPWVGRLRPSHDPEVSPHIRLVRAYRGGTYSFPSGHAANSMAAACTFAGYVRHPVVWGIGLTWAILHSLTRLYLGVHYPSDIIGGWVVGIGVSAVLLAVFRRRNA